MHYKNKAVNWNVNPYVTFDMIVPLQLAWQMLGQHQIYAFKKIYNFEGSLV